MAFIAILAITPIVRATQAKIHNKCSFEVYLWLVTADYLFNIITLWPADIHNKTY